jgi:ribosome-binding protein aMBF1 (putative translation factor)
MEKELKIREVLDILEDITTKRFSHTALYKWRDAGLFPKPWTKESTIARGNAYMNPPPKPPRKRKQLRKVVPMSLAQDLIREVLHKRSITQAELARRIGKSNSTLTRIMQNKLWMTPELFDEIEKEK